MNLFDVLGPIMVGPSSSHTAGAARIGYVSKCLLNEKPVKADIYFHGSFATTGYGHGTDKAIIAGLLGMKPDDSRLKDSFLLAKEQGIDFSFHKIVLKDAHPNSTVLELEGESGKKIKILASSVGGGRIMINQLNDILVNFSAECPTLVIHNVDQPGHVAEVTSTLSLKKVNIGSMRVYRNKRGGEAVMVIETDEIIPEEALHWLRCLDGVKQLIFLSGE